MDRRTHGAGPTIEPTPRPVRRAGLAAVAIPLAMGYGLFAFGALGDSYFAFGALAGLYAAALAGIVCVALGDRTRMIYAPRVTTTFFLGALLHSLVGVHADGLRGGESRHSRVLRDHPAGWRAASAVRHDAAWLVVAIHAAPGHGRAAKRGGGASLLVQFGNVCGFDRRRPVHSDHRAFGGGEAAQHRDFARHLHLMWNARAITTKVPPLLVGIGIGTALHFGIVAAGFGSDLGPVIGMPGTVQSPGPTLSHIESLSGAAASPNFLPLIVGGAFALAVVAALDTLLCAKLAMPPGGPKEDGNRLLVRLGLGNVASACFGGITSGINIGPSIVNRTFGAKSSLSVLINVAVVLAVIFVLFPVVSYMPRAVLSATIMVIAVQHIDPWSIDLVRRIGAASSRHRVLMLLDLLVVAAVAVLSITINIVLAVFIGIVIAIALFIARMSRSNILRSLYRCDTIRSRKARAQQQTAVLEKLGGQILVLELQGVLFFGSAETLSEDIERLASDTRTVILDLQRITEIDATGMRILREIRLTLAREHRHLAFALAESSELATRLDGAGIIDVIGRERLFADVDRAIEWAEDDVLSWTDATEAEGGELPLAG